MIKEILYILYFICRGICGVALFFIGLFTFAFASIYFTCGQEYFIKQLADIDPKSIWLIATFMFISGICAFVVPVWMVLMKGKKGNEKG